MNTRKNYFYNFGYFCYFEIEKNSKCSREVGNHKGKMDKIYQLNILIQLGGWMTSIMEKVAVYWQTERIHLGFLGPHLTQGTSESERPHCLKCQKKTDIE